MYIMARKPSKKLSWFGTVVLAFIVMFIIGEALYLLRPQPASVPQQDAGMALVDGGPEVSMVELKVGVDDLGKDINLLLGIYEKNYAELRACEQRNKKLAKSRLHYKNLAEKSCAGCVVP